VPTPAIAVFCSGHGTNLQAIIGAIRRRRLRARIAVVICDYPGAYAIVRAQAAGIPTVVIDPRRFPSRESFDRALSRILKRAGATWIVLAGFMRILSRGFIHRYRHRVLNIHPALLPAFPGCHGVRDALRHGVKVTGVTVHFVDEQVDHGPIIFQEPVRILERDTEETLLNRVHRLEHRLYPQAIQAAVSGRIKIVGRKVILRADA